MSSPLTLFMPTPVGISNFGSNCSRDSWENRGQKRKGIPDRSRSSQVLWICRSAYPIRHRGAAEWVVISRGLGVRSFVPIQALFCHQYTDLKGQSLTLGRHDCPAGCYGGELTSIDRSTDYHLREPSAPRSGRAGPCGEFPPPSTGCATHRGV
jgi:hypothetical protein